MAPKTCCCNQYRHILACAPTQWNPRPSSWFWTIVGRILSTSIAPFASRLALSDRCCIVTGGTRGMGLVMAQAIVEAGGRVLITASREPEALQQVEEDFYKRYGPGRLKACQADVSDPEQCEKVIDVAIYEFGALDVLVNNAG